MLKRVTARERISMLLHEHAALVRAAFLEAIAKVKSAARAEHMAGAVAAAEIDKAALNPALDAIAKAFNDGGVPAMDCECCAIRMVTA